MSYKMYDVVTVKNNKLNGEEIIEGRAIIRAKLVDIDDTYLVAFEITDENGGVHYEDQAVERRVL